MDKRFKVTVPSAINVLDYTHALPGGPNGRPKEYPLEPGTYELEPIPHPLKTKRRDPDGKETDAVLTLLVLKDTKIGAFIDWWFERAQIDDEAYRMVIEEI